MVVNSGLTHTQFITDHDIILDVREDLHKADIPWKPSMMIIKPIDDSCHVIKSIIGIFNKLTLQNFDSLSHKLQFIIAENGYVTLDNIIEVVFEIFVTSPNFSSVFAKMCCKLSEQLKNSKAARFEERLLNKCHVEFEKKLLSTEELLRLEAQLTNEIELRKKGELNELIEYEKVKIKGRFRGVIKFLGELFNENMLKYEYMHVCVEEFINEMDDENSVEFLCLLLTTIGAKFHTINSPEFNGVNSYLCKMESSSMKKTISNRSRFLIQNVLDLHKNNWVFRRDQMNFNNKPTLEYQKESVKKLAHSSSKKSKNSKMHDAPKEKSVERKNRLMSSRNPVVVDGLSHDSVITFCGSGQNKCLNKTEACSSGDKFFDAGTYYVSNALQLSKDNIFCLDDAKGLSPQNHIRVASLKMSTEDKKTEVESCSELPDLKADFTKFQNSDVTIELANSNKKNMIFDEIMIKFVYELTNENLDSQSLISWIKDNISKEQMNEISIISALISTSLEWSTYFEGKIMHLNEDRMIFVSRVLKSFISSSQSRLICLTSIQAFIHQASNPSGILVKIISILLDNEVLSEESISEWESNCSS